MSFIQKITQNLKVKCEFCKGSIKKKDAHFENVKLMEFISPRDTPFCNKKCASRCKRYEMNAPRKVSLCSSCPTPPALLK